ncbi:hypothetical protein [Pseudomonas sp. AE27]|uniref:hypothetical protein n=1 Tax=Pseudomonas sp. AE27 TaxID=3127460 RepID=UPI0030D250C5
MKITDLNLEEMLGEIAAAVSPFVFGDLGPETPAKTYVERTALQGEVMGRIMAVLMKDEICGDTLVEEVEACSRHVHEHTLKHLRSAMIKEV